MRKRPRDSEHAHDPQPRGDDDRSPEPGPFSREPEYGPDSEADFEPPIAEVESDDDAAEIVEMTIHKVTQGESNEDGFRSVSVLTDRGETQMRLFGGPEDWELPDVESAMQDPSLVGPSRFVAGVILVTGAVGGWHSPAKGLYDRLSESLAQHDIPTLRVRFRDAHDLLESALDVLSGAAYLEAMGIRRLGVVGHSFGGAAAIQAAAQQSLITSVVTLASQSAGAEAAADLGPDRSLLVLHGQADEILPAWTSHQINRISTARTRLITYPGASHNLDQASHAVHNETLNWILGTLGPCGA